MTTATIRRYELRSAPLIFLSWLVGSYVGVILASLASDVAHNLLSKEPPAGHNQFLDDFPGWLRSTTVWGLWLAAYPLLGFISVAWPTLAVVLKKRPNWLRPTLIYALGLSAGIVGFVVADGWALAEYASGGSPLTLVLANLGDAIASGTAVGLPAAVIFRLVALRPAGDPLGGPVGATSIG